MCDLNQQESRHILDTLSEINSLAGQVEGHRSSIEQTAYMDHENLAALLANLERQVTTAKAWVVAKPQEHAGHTGH
jgi:hypothetical protein